MQHAHVPKSGQKTASADTVSTKGRSFPAPSARQAPLSCDITAQAKGENGQPLQGVFQFYGDWIWEGVQAMYNNPGTTIAALGVTAAAIKGAYNYLTTPTPTAPPNRNTLEGVASVMGITAHALEQHLEGGPLNDQTYDSANITNALPGTGVAKGLIPPSLITNFGPLKGAAKLHVIFNRMNNFPFSYSGNYTNGYNGFLKKTGDCQTLVQMFVLAAQAAGISGVEIKDKQQTEMLVTGAPIHGRAQQSNVRDNSYWYFFEHYWAVHEGKSYDLLFMDSKAPTTYYYKQQKTYANVNYKLFDSGRCMIMASELLAKLNIQLAPGVLGVVRNKEQDIKAYIQNPN